MEPQPYHEDEIDRYLRQEMNSEDKTAFEQRLRQDKALQAEVALQQDIARGIDLYGGESLKKQLQAVELEEAKSKTGPSRDQRRGRSLYVWLGVAASVSALLLIVILLFNQTADPQELYAAYYEPYPNVVNPAQRSEGVPPDDAGQAMYFYERGDFERAIELFTQESSLNDQAYRFYLGVSYLGAEQAADALSTLQPLLSDPQGAFYEPALWYSGLAHLQANQPEPAKEIFQRVVTLDRDYQADARDLLEEL